MPNQTGKDILQLARKHVGEKYVLGVLVPKNNARWAGPWDCAEFASWIIFQLSEQLYGCDRQTGDPATANAYSGDWGEDANRRGKKISVNDAAATPGAILVRLPANGAYGHVVVSDGMGGTVEAHSSKRGVIESTLNNRRWDLGVLVPGFDFSINTEPVIIQAPKVQIFRVMTPPMTGGTVSNIQRALRAAGFNAGGIDGVFGPQTQAAVSAFQLSRGLLPDGEVGPLTAKALGVSLPPA